MSQLTVGSITAGRVVASGYVSTTGQLQLPSYDTATRPTSADDGVLVWNNTAQLLILEQQVGGRLLVVLQLRRGIILLVLHHNQLGHMDLIQSLINLKFIFLMVGML